MTTATRVPPTYVNCNRLWVDSWPRAQAQGILEARALLQLGGRADGARALELGPGRRGTGLLLALDAFGADSAHGVELHPASVQSCRRAVGGRATVEQGDVTALAAPDGSYDAVFGYHVLHHADDWRAAVAEAARVLTPGGRFYSAEMTARFVDSTALRAVSHHPRDGDRPTPQAVAQACAAAGLDVVGQTTRYLGWWTALVAQKP
ncbi:MAG: SAM-dependent methyltransferase [Frankiales bacterium]|nr:SAM-dependent methyltransferase [Frankiales bacterium]